MSHDHADAKKFRDLVASIARAEIEKMFPQDRYAQVKEILEDERRVIVQYNGEPSDNLVSVPYNSVKPAYVDQWVRIGGGAGDRHVIDTLGESSAEVRTEEVLSEAPLHPKWMQPDLRMVDTAPAATQADTNDSLLTESNRISGTLVRIPTRMTVGEMRVYIKAGRSGSIRGLLYRMTPQFDGELLAQTGLVSANVTNAERTLPFETHVPLERGDHVLVAVHNRAGGDVTMGGWLHRPPRGINPGDSLTFHRDGHTSPPQTILDSQWDGRYADRSWYFTLVRSD